MLTKKTVIQTINELPEQFTVDQLIDSVLLLQKVKMGEDEEGQHDLSNALEKRKLKKALAFKRKSF